MIKTISLSLVAISLLLISMVAIAEPPNVEYYPIQPPPPQQQSPIDNVVTILLDQGFAGAIIVILFLWTYKTDKNNRASQKENFDKFVAISAECSAHMASVSARLENIERELESTKQLEQIEMLRKV